MAHEECTCGVTRSENTVLQPLGHSYGELVLATPASCKAEGTVAHYECSVCGQYFDEEKNKISSITVSMTDHTYGDLLEAVESDCENDGTLEHYECSVCNKYFDADENELSSITVSAKGHQLGDWTEAVESTCEENGTLGYYHCSVCDKYLDENEETLSSLVDPAKGHAWVPNSVGADCDTCGATGRAVWQLVTNASALKAGDKLIIVSNSKGKVAGAMSGVYLTSISVTISNNTINNLPSDATIFTLGGKSGAWTLAGANGKLLGATAVKKLAWGSGTTTWTITISSNNATIQNTTSSYGRFLYNVNSPRFLSYDSNTSVNMILPQLYSLSYIVCDHSSNSNKDDSNCATAFTCSACGYVLTAAIEHSYSLVCDDTCDNEGCKYVRPVTHTPNEDDGDCTTAVKCTVCSGIAVPAQAAHNFVNKVCSVCGKSEAKVIAKATSIAVGDVVYIVCEGKKVELNGISTTSTKYGVGFDYSSSGKVGKYALTVVAGSSSGTYAFKTSDGKYLAWSSGNTLITSSELNSNSSWKVTFSGGNAVITNAKDSSRKLQWNASSPRFACYTSSQTVIQIYKET